MVVFCEPFNVSEHFSTIGPKIYSKKQKLSIQDETF